MKRLQQKSRKPDLEVEYEKGENGALFVELKATGAGRALTTEHCRSRDTVFCGFSCFYLMGLISLPL